MPLHKLPRAIHIVGTQKLCTYYMDGPLLAIEFIVSLSHPTERRLIAAVQTVVKVDERVVVLHVLIKSVLQIPTTFKTTIITSNVINNSCTTFHFLTASTN